MDTAEAPRKKLLIRADSSSQIGLGHIMRDLVLAQQYPNTAIAFACQNLPGNIIDRIPYPVHILASNNPVELIELIISHTIDMVVFDHYGIDAAYEKQIKEQTGIIILSLDDTYRPHHCDIILNHNIGANASRYRYLVPPATDIRCGITYALIREEFKNLKPKNRILIDKKKLTVFIAMGGTDPLQLNLKILKVLQNFPYIRACMVTTTSNKNLKSLVRYVKCHKNISLHIDAENIAELMNSADFAIVTPSVTCSEVLKMKLPFIALKTADNQSKVFRYLHAKRFLTIDKFHPDTMNLSVRKITSKKYGTYLKRITHLKE